MCGKLLMEDEDVACAFCAIGLPRYRVVRLEDNLLLMLWELPFLCLILAVEQLLDACLALLHEPFGG